MSPGGLGLEAAWGLWPLAGWAQLGLVAWNLRRFTQGPQAKEAEPRPWHLLVPARNEAARVPGLVATALAQPGLAALWLLDDGSTDGTAEAARQAAAGDPRLRILAGRPRPPGWAGKPWACQQLGEAAEAAGARQLVFMDADVALGAPLAPWLTEAEAQGWALLSVWPRQAVGQPAERLILPLLAQVLLAHLPLAWAERWREPSLSAANGQLLVLEAKAYRAWGGHAPVAGAIAEDVELARVCKGAGGRLACRDAGAIASCRMYPEGWVSLAPGFTKNLFPAFGGGWAPFALGWLLWVLGQALPWPVALLAGLAWGAGASGPWGLLAAAALLQGLATLAQRLLLARALGQERSSALAHPLAATLLAGLMLASAWAWASGRGVQWKGRRYGQQSPEANEGSPQD